MNPRAGVLIAVSLGIAASAGFSYLSGNIWAGFFCVIFISICYLIYLDRTVVTSLNHNKHKVAIRVLIAALVVVQVYASYMSYDQSQFTKNNLTETRSTIDEGASKFHTQQVLLDTFLHYYSRADEPDASIASSFKEVMGDRLNADGTLDFTPPQLNEDVVFKYEIVSPDEVVITASAKIGKGENPQFVNVSTETGKYQAVATLTPNGIGYEREN